MRRDVAPMKEFNGNQIRAALPHGFGTSTSLKPPNPTRSHRHARTAQRPFSGEDTFKTKETNKHPQDQLSGPHATLNRRHSHTEDCVDHAKNATPRQSVAWTARHGRSKDHCATGDAVDKESLPLLHACPRKGLRIHGTSLLATKESQCGNTRR